VHACSYSIDLAAQSKGNVLAGMHAAPMVARRRRPVSRSVQGFGSEMAAAPASMTVCYNHFGRAHAACNAAAGAQARTGKVRGDRAGPDDSLGRRLLQPAGASPCECRLCSKISKYYTVVTARPALHRLHTHQAMFSGRVV